MDYRAYIEEVTQCIGDNATEVMLVEDVTQMLDIIESELQSAVEGLMKIEGLPEIDDAKTKLSEILDDLY